MSDVSHTVLYYMILLYYYTTILLFYYDFRKFCEKWRRKRGAVGATAPTRFDLGGRGIVQLVFKTKSTVSHINGTLGRKNNIGLKILCNLLNNCISILSILKFYTRLIICQKKQKIRK